MNLFLTLNSSTKCLNLALVIIFVSYFSTARGFNHELWLYQNAGNSLHFKAHVPDASVYYPVLEQVNRYCARGKWFVYDEVNFHNLSSGLGLAFTSDLICANVNVSEARSFRFWGANDTSVSALSLYKGSSFDGEELLVRGRAYAGIPFEVKSIAATGTMNWRLFEGEHLNGHSICYKVPVAAGYFYNFDRVKHIRIGNIRSVFKGCDLNDVESYKKKHILNIFTLNYKK